MTDEQPAFLTGRLLLAMPGMGDPRFERAVILMAAHDEDGALGIGIGKQSAAIDFEDLLESLGVEGTSAPHAPILEGGPVEPGRGFVLHSDDWGGQDTVRIADLCSLTGTLDVLRALGEGRGPSDFLVALGYAGWGAGQLDDEMTRHGWLVADASRDLLFATPPEERWARAMRSLGIDPAALAAETGAA